MRRTYTVSVDAEIDQATIDRLMESSLALFEQRIWDHAPTDKPYTITTTDWADNLIPDMCHRFDPEEQPHE